MKFAASSFYHKCTKWPWAIAMPGRMLAEHGTLHNAHFSKYYLISFDFLTAAKQIMTDEPRYSVGTSEPEN